MLLNEQGIEKKFKLSSLKWCLSSGEPLPAATYNEFKQRFDAEIFDCLGQMEIHIFLASWRGSPVKPGSMGKHFTGLHFPTHRRTTMEVTGTYTFKASRAVVWDLLTKRDFLEKVIPGCNELKEVEPDNFKVNIELGLAGIKGKYEGKVRLTDKDHPNRYKMFVEGSGKPGFIKAEGLLEFTEPQPGATLLSYRGQFQAGGLIASIGQRMLDGAAKLMIKQFFKSMEEQIPKS